MRWTAEPAPRGERGARFLNMVGELHRRGYQRLRIAPGMSSSGFYWRCHVTPISNVSIEHGARYVSFDERLVATYTSGSGTRFFDWPDASRLSAEGLATLFVQRFPEIAEAGRGSDWLYVGWYVQMLWMTDPESFPIAYADYFPDGCLMTVGAKQIQLPMPPPGASPVGPKPARRVPVEGGPLELRAHHWYALELYDQGFPWSPMPSPIRVEAITPLKSGRSIVDLAFFHANYPEGVQEKRYRLRVLLREPGIFIGERVADPTDHRVAVVMNLTREWMTVRMPEWPVPIGAEPAEVLERTFPRVAGC